MRVTSRRFDRIVTFALSNEYAQFHAGCGQDLRKNLLSAGALAQRIPAHMDRIADLRIIRRAYARQVVAAVGGVREARIEAAFAAVPREDFLGPGPWLVSRMARFVPTPDADPVYLYTDDLVAIAPERHITCGQPSLHAFLIATAMPKQGEHVVHVGAGVGYYTAILAHVVGPGGRVTAIELESDLAERARANLSTYPNVEVIQGDGATAPFDIADVIYVNAGVTRPADTWLDRLTEGGRLILPLTADHDFKLSGLTRDPAKLWLRGAVFRIERHGSDYLARWIAPVAIFPCSGSRDKEGVKAVAAALQKGTPWSVTRLYRNEDVPADRCWLRGTQWCLAYR